MFTGCLKVHKIDNRDPILYLMEGNRRVRTLPKGQLQVSCSESQSFPIALTKTRSSLSINIQQNKTENRLKLKVYVRTLCMKGIILSTIQGNYSVELGMNNTYVYLKLWEKKKLLQEIHSSETINDGVCMIVCLYNRTQHHFTSG